MLKKEQEQYLADTLGMNIETLKKALTSEEEVEISYKSGTFLDDEGLTSLKSAVKSEGYNEGKIAGVEIKAKEIKEKYGYDIEGKDLDKIFEHHGSKILESAKIEPNKKVTELSTSLENLQKQYETDLSEKEKAIQSLQAEKTQIKSNNDLMFNIPEGLKGISNEDFATIAKSKFNFGYDDSGNFIAKDLSGNVIKDKLEKPVPPKDILSNFATEKNWFGSNGRGGGDGAGEPSGFQSMNDVYKHMESSKIDPLSPEGQNLIDNFNKQ